MNILPALFSGLFAFFRNNQNTEFVSEKSFLKNTASQLRMTPQTILKLREYNVKQDSELKLEFFFYTNNIEKATSLADELRTLNYEVETKQAAGNKKQFVITGWTPKMKIEDSVVSDWTQKMCETGFSFDCEFDGWGTSIDQ